MRVGFHGASPFIFRRTFSARSGTIVPTIWQMVERSLIKENGYAENLPAADDGAGAVADSRIGADDRRTQQRWKEPRKRLDPKHGSRPQELQPARANQQIERQAARADLEYESDE